MVEKKKIEAKKESKEKHNLEEKKSFKSLAEELK